MTVDPEGLNPGIRRLVAGLNAAGWPTCDSGDGQTHDHSCDRDHAYVVIALPPHRAAHLIEEAEAVAAWLRERGVHPTAIGGDGPCIQASYDPGNSRAFIDVMNVRDAMLAEVRS